MTALPLRGAGHPRLLLELDLTRGLLEAGPASPFEAVRSARIPTLRAVVEALDKAAGDGRVAGLVAHVGHRQPTLAQSGEVRAAVDRFRRSGKPAVCWAESYGELGPGNVGYHLASAFGEVWVQPSGDVGLTGVAAEVVFARDLLDRIGVQPQIGQRHEYKTAADLLLRSTMTGPHREMMTRIVESLTSTIIADVARGRRLDESLVREAVDAAPLSAQEGLERGLVDRIGYRDEVYADLRRRLGEVETRYVDRYGKGVAGIARAGAERVHRRRPVVALLHASGGIHLGRSGRSSPVSGRSIGSDTLGAALRAAGRDDAVRAVVLRIDSRGGSYVASDAIRREVRLLRRTGRPVVASMASVAASGGYYIAMAADEVLASAGTLTGSIGVLAGKQVIREALAKVGLNRETVASGRYADMFSSQRPFDEDEWRRLEEWLDRVYDDFTLKAAQDRRMPVEQLRAVARGRVWTGADAVDVGLVDRLGGLSEALDAACARAGLARAEVDVRPMPKAHPLELLRPAENSDAPAAARLGEGAPLPDRLLGLLGLPVHGVLTMPLDWRFR